jgi:YegS/Rv2252/BmrU family lipid kinase
VVVSYGGDGTLNEVIQALAGSDTPVAVWPGGTANVVARDLGMPGRFEDLADAIARGATRRIALGLARRVAVLNENRENGQEKSELDPSRYFMMFAGIGLDASVALNVNLKLKRRTGELAYWLEGMKHLWTWPADLFSVRVDGQEYEGVFALVGNGKSYGGGISLTPNARLDEPWFEVYVLPQLSSNFAYLRDLALCLTGKPELSRAKLVRGRHVIANSSTEPWVELDGEVIGQLPMSFDVVPEALSVIVP